MSSLLRLMCVLYLGTQIVLRREQSIRAADGYCKVHIKFAITELRLKNDRQPMAFACIESSNGA